MKASDLVIADSGAWTKRSRVAFIAAVHGKQRLDLGAQHRIGAALARQECITVRG
jgi:hypothetical protein